MGILRKIGDMSKSVARRTLAGAKRVPFKTLGALAGAALGTAAFLSPPDDTPAWDADLTKRPPRKSKPMVLAPSVWDGIDIEPRPLNFQTREQHLASVARNPSPTRRRALAQKQKVEERRRQDKDEQRRKQVIQKKKQDDSDYRAAHLAAYTSQYLTPKQRQEHRQSESRRAARAKKATQPQYMTPDQIYQQLMAGPSRHK
jgi:hypothetical protein